MEGKWLCPYLHVELRNPEPISLITLYPTKLMITLGTLEKSVGGQWKLCTAGGQGLSEFLEVEPAVQLSHQESHSRLGPSRDELFPVELMGILSGPTRVSHFRVADPDLSHVKNLNYCWPGRDFETRADFNPSTQEYNQDLRLCLFPITNYRYTNSFFTFLLLFS